MLKAISNERDETGKTTTWAKWVSSATRKIAFYRCIIYTYSCMTIPLEFEQVLDFSLIFIYFQWFYCLLILTKFDIEYESFLGKHQKKNERRKF